MKQLSRLPILLVLGLSACSRGLVDVPADHAGTQANSAVPSRDTGAAFQTDSLSYTLVPTAAGLEGKISFVFTNPTRAPVYIVNCNGATSLRLEQRSGNRWVPAWSPIIQDCLSPPIVIQPGQQYSAAVHVFAGYPSSNLYPKFRVDPVPGTYRIVWIDVLRTYNPRSYPFGEALPYEQRVSNRFELRIGSR